MTELDTLIDWASTLIVASLTWVAGIGGGPATAPAKAELPTMLGWAQTTDASDIQQVGEETGADGDVEELDAGVPPVESVETVAASEDAVSTGPVEDDDIELLDQGSPPVTTTVTTLTEPAPIPATAAPSDDGVVYVAPEPSQSSEPVLPEGFGDGQVHVSAGIREFPPGLEGCEVGAVTGRAYVGIDCDGDGSDVVGHAPTFEDFPFVLEDTFPFDPDSRLLTEENFPFDENAGFFAGGADDDGGNDTILVSAGRGTGNAAIGSTDDGGSSVTLAQRARDRAARADSADDSGSDRAAKSNKRNRSNASGSSANDSSGSGSGKETASDSTKAEKDKSRAKKAKKDRGDERDGKAKKGKKSKEKHSGKTGKGKNKKKRSGKKR